ncbi:MAG: hypothetical protein IJF92_00435 [Bacilli bacterium]|nr:hypothetical protein [Bacilli bacterium]MBQ3307545.1 hypothetical protein [Bacilli bacterium]MBQ3422143.1 hypothetical protein [Romboutsia sp.]
MEKSIQNSGLNTPEEVKKALNIKEVILNGNKIQLNFWDQMDKPFLLDKSAGELFKFIVDSGENDQLSSVLKSMVSDRQQINREADIVQGSIISTENMIKEQQSVLDKTKTMLENADRVIDMKEKYDEYKSVKHLVDTYTEAENEIKETRPKLLEDLGKFDSYNILDYLIKDKLKEMIDIRNKVKEWNSLNLEEHNETELRNIISNKENILKNIDIHQNKNLRNIVQSYNNIKIDIENTSEAILKLEKAIPSNTIIDNLSLLVELKNIKFNVDYMNETIIKEQNNIEELNRKELELDEIRRNIKVCPLCGQKIGGEHVHRENVSE